MLGLIKKDFLLIKGNLKLVSIIFIVLIFISFEESSNFIFIPAFISIILFFSTFSYDEYNKWDAYAITFPNGKENIVKSKYLSTLLLVLFTVLITMIIWIIISIVNNNLDIEYILLTSFGCFASVIFLQSIMYPLIFKFGIEKSRIVIFIGIFLLIAIIGLISRNIGSIPIEVVSLFNNYWMIIVPLIIIITFSVSYYLSKKTYMKKEF